MSEEFARRMADAILAFADIAEFKKCRCSMIKGTPEFEEMLISAKRFHNETGQGLKPNQERSSYDARNNRFAWADRRKA